jgi:segregation and condensation protein B
MIEALLFASDAPLSAAELARADEGLDEERVEAMIADLKLEYEREDRAFGLVEIGGGYQILTRPEYGPLLERFETVPVSSRLSGPALETLAIIAYRQPVDRAEVEEIRGVGAGGVLRTLLEREMIEVTGRGEGLGRPLLYGTSSRFLEHFGFRALDDLPRPDDLPVILRRETLHAEG